jgi:hypothetical protein
VRKVLKSVIKYLKFIFYGYWKIPRGPYCHGETRQTYCPYWKLISFLPDQENGYCAWLEKGDIDKNNDDSIMLEQIDLKTGEVIDRISASEMPFGISLLWDQCKECRFKRWERKLF